jgi:hypothetical protein
MHVLPSCSGGLVEFWILTGLTFQQSYATIEMPLIGCPPQPVRGIFIIRYVILQDSQVVLLGGITAYRE